MNAEDVDKFLGLSKGAFSHIPGYAMEAALQAIAKVRDLEDKHLFRPGLYYIALTDLTASTVASAHLSADLNQRRIEAFITATVEALGSIHLRNYAQFVKEIGDASLFLFSSFEDLHDWWKATQENLESYNQEYQCSGEVEDHEWQYFELSAKSVVHLGEVSFAERKNPIALSVNQVFKIEKMFQAGELGATEPVRQSAAPALLNRKLKPSKTGDVVLPGDCDPTLVWLLDRWPAQQNAQADGPAFGGPAA